MLQRWFYGNRLTGQIPTELGLLKLMNRLQLEENSFTGAMPTEVCNNIGFFGRLSKLGADCSDIDFEVRAECDSGPHRLSFRDMSSHASIFVSPPVLLLHMLQPWGMQP